MVAKVPPHPATWARLVGPAGGVVTPPAVRPQPSRPPPSSPPAPHLHHSLFILFPVLSRRLSRRRGGWWEPQTGPVAQRGSQPRHPVRGRTGGIPDVRGWRRGSISSSSGTPHLPTAAALALEILRWGRRDASPAPQASSDGGAEGKEHAQRRS